MPRTHTLKTLPQLFNAIQSGDKTFEVRKDDRAFQTGDLLELVYYDPAEMIPLSNPPKGPNPSPSINVRVTFVLSGGQYGIEPGFCVLGIKNID